MNESQRRQIDEWHRRGYLPRLGDLAESYSAPFWWHDPGQPVGSRTRHNGTMVFVNTGARVLGVTANHVYQACVRDMSGDSGLVCQVGGITFDPTPRLIDSSTSLDLATFELSEIFVSGSLSNTFSAEKWPPSPIEDGELALLGGFPGALRNERGGETDFDFPCFITRADSSSPTQAGVLLNLAESYNPEGPPLPPEANLGGASGGPVFRVHDGELRPLELVGFIYEYSPSMELMYARHASSVRADGTLSEDPAA